MTIIDLCRNLIWRYMWIGPGWHLFTYMFTLLFAFVILKYTKNKKVSKVKYFLMIFLFFYLITVYISTVMARRYKSGVLISIKPLSSWKKALTGDKLSEMMLIENILMLLPLGCFLPLIDRSKNRCGRTVLIGFLFSLFIEISQFVRKTGLFEVDDLINNTLGVIIGYALAIIILKLTEAVTKGIRNGISER